jgi:hypothetical protein
MGQTLPSAAPDTMFSTPWEVISNLHKILQMGQTLHLEWHPVFIKKHTSHEQNPLTLVSLGSFWAMLLETFWDTGI